MWLRIPCKKGNSLATPIKCRIIAKLIYCTAAIYVLPRENNLQFKIVNERFMEIDLQCLFTPKSSRATKFYTSKLLDSRYLEWSWKAKRILLQTASNMYYT